MRRGGSTHLLEARGRCVKGGRGSVFNTKGLGEMIEDALEFALRHHETGVLEDDGEDLDNARAKRGGRVLRAELHHETGRALQLGHSRCR